MDFEKGYRINLVGIHYLLEAIRTAGDGYHPKLVFTSSIAVFGAPFPSEIHDEFHHTPLTSYGTQKGMCELLLADYTRKGFLDGVGIRLPTICVRPGKPNKAASGFFSNIIREPLAGEEAVLPVEESVMHWHASPRSAVGFLLHAASLTREQLGPAHQSHDAGRRLHGRRADRRAAPRRGRECRGAHPPRAGRRDHEDRVGLADAVRRQARPLRSDSRWRTRSTRSSARISTTNWAARSRRSGTLRRGLGSSAGRGVRTRTSEILISFSVHAASPSRPATRSRPRHRSRSRLDLPDRRSRFAKPGGRPVRRLNKCGSGCIKWDVCRNLGLKR